MKLEVWFDEGRGIPGFGLSALDANEMATQPIWIRENGIVLEDGRRIAPHRIYSMKISQTGAAAPKESPQWIAASRVTAAACLFMDVYDRPVDDHLRRTAAEDLRAAVSAWRALA